MKIHKFLYTFFIIGALFVSASSVHAFTVGANAITVLTGQNAYVSLSSSAGASVSNSNPNAFSASLSGNQITISGVAVGNGSINICITGDGCQSIQVTVNSSTVTTTTTATPITFSSGTSLTMQAGQSQTVTVSGAGGYIMQGNSSPDIVGASVGGNSLFLQGNTAGGANITVCDSANNCAVLYVSVTGILPSVVTLPSIISFSVSSSGSGQTFFQTGSIMHVSFNTNVAIASANVKIGSVQLTPSGLVNGSLTSFTGPFTASYTLNGSESMPLPISINVSDANGHTANFSFSLGAPNSVAVSVPVTTTSSGTSSADPIFLYRFQSPLSLGMTSTDVLALQKRLNAEGDYSGPYTGYFGALTEAAVKVYQGEHGLDTLGSVGPGTRAALNSGQ